MSDPVKVAAPDGWTVIGIDFGLRHMGIAVAGSATRRASALDVVAAVNGIPRWSRLEGILARWRPAWLVVGLPLNMDGSASEMSRRAEAFGRRLEKRYSIPCHTCDERLSTREAQWRLADAGRNGGKQHGGAHGLAAQIILEGWLRGQGRVLLERSG